MQIFGQIRKLLKRALQATYFISGDGNWSLLRHEKLILMAVADTFAPEIRRLLLEQLAQDFFVERTNSRINILRFYFKHEDMRILSPEFEDKWLRIQLQVNGSKETSNVNIYRGFIFSVETRSPSKRYKGAEVSVKKIDNGSGAKSFTKAIDRQEHGRE